MSKHPKRPDVEQIARLCAEWRSELWLDGHVVAIDMEQELSPLGAQQVADALLDVGVWLVALRHFRPGEGPHIILRLAKRLQQPHLFQFVARTPHTLAGRLIGGHTIVWLAAPTPHDTEDFFSLVGALVEVWREEARRRGRNLLKRFPERHTSGLVWPQWVVIAGGVPTPTRARSLAEELFGEELIEVGDD